MLLSSIKPACGQLSTARYRLATTTPNMVIKGNAMPPKPSAETDSAASLGSSCQVLVTFTGLTQVPVTATLVIDQAGTSSTVMLAVSRNVTLNDYLVIPAIVGGSLTIATFLSSVLLVWIYDRKRKKPPARFWPWLMRPILGSGAWTANDSWATNISTGLVVVGVVITATAAADSLFPGVALDRFALVNILAGFFVAAAPVVFGILYSWLTAQRPGLIADAVVSLPGLRMATISVPSGASITLAADTFIQDGSAQWAQVRGGGTYQIPPGATIQVAAGVQEIVRPCYEAAEQAVDDVLAEAFGRVSVEAAVLASVDAASVAVQQVVEQAVAWAGSYAPARALADRFRRAVERAVERALREALQRPADVTVVEVYTVDTAGAQAAARTDLKAGRQALRLAIEQAVAQLSIPDGSLPTRRDISSALEGTGIRTAVEKVVRAAAGAAGSHVRPATVEDHTNKIIETMKEKVPNIPAQAYGAMACSGAADIGVLPGSVLQIDKIDAWDGTLTIQGSDVVLQPSSPSAPPEQPEQPEPSAPNVRLVQLVPAPSQGPPDVQLHQPVLISAAGGAKLTVTGTADITLPQDTQISAPQGRYYELRKTAPLMVPQGTNIIVANLGIILVVNFFTMFGIGAELGIASVLADFSDATSAGHNGMWAALAAVALLVFVYAVTATRTMADPQPGSSISSQAGTSFTL